MALTFQHSKKAHLFLACSVLLFLTLDSAMLALNFRITHAVSEDAVIINLAGRQRMLSQKMTKSIFQISPEQLKSKQTQTHILQYMQAYEMFNDTLEAFNNSGYVIDAEKKLVMVKAINHPEARTIITRAAKLLEPLHALNLNIMKTGLTPELFQQIKTLLGDNNEQLLNQMNQLTVMVEKSSRQQTQDLRSIQLVTFALALLNFAFIITQFRRGQRHSEQTINVLNDLIQSAKAALLIYDEAGKVVMANESARRMFGYNEEEVGTLNKRQLFDHEGEQWIALTRSGKRVPIELHERSLIRNGETVTIATIIETRHQLAKNQSLFQLANRDTLTGMFNRNALTIVLYHKAQQTKFWGSRFACFAISLNNFSQVNKEYGKDIGDELLKEFTYRLCKTTRDSDFIYRYGGDEFVLVVDLADNDAALSQITHKINKAMQDPFTLTNNISFEVSPSIGVAICPDDEADPEELITMAHELMNRGKGSQVIEFSKAIQARHPQYHNEKQ
ncbi:diguanylate cyclase [Vibrio sp. CAIM 722]|uniref:Diguanylate cyclase n=1 Tax=Vibrio eleionomae TaxID=2653505 RepID=A0A7X4LIW8_9VIBR|nr:diguanylate cyclase [Vibrio eleionomae]MZI92747.1 diguanylate cyclase [Vibrio eleionomae]